MIRHVSVSSEDHVIADTPCFAWFNTIDDTFLSFSRAQVWATWEDFERDWHDETGHKYPLDRFKGLFPNNNISAQQGRVK